MGENQTVQSEWQLDAPVVMFSFGFCIICLLILVQVYQYLYMLLVCVCVYVRVSACVCVLVCVRARASLKRYGKYVLSNRKMVDTHKKLIGVYSYQEAGNLQAFQVNFSLSWQVVVAVLLDNFFKVK